MFKRFITEPSLFAHSRMLKSWDVLTVGSTMSCISAYAGRESEHAEGSPRREGAMSWPQVDNQTDRHEARTRKGIKTSPQTINSRQLEHSFTNGAVCSKA